MANRTTAGRSQAGFTYLIVLILVAALGFGLAAVGEFTSHAEQRAKEVELLFVGNQFRDAIGAYYENTPGIAKRYPQKLEDLLQDNRFPTIKRYLRRVYVDPMTAKADWGLVEAPGGGIMGVYSRSSAEPVKTGNFAAADRAFNGATRYSDWQFSYLPVNPAAAPASPSAAQAAPQAPAPRGG
jgi:type II secretory pathway pseudopilin PulG